MYRQLACAVITLLLSVPALAAGRITEEQIRQVMAATDTAAINRDTDGIGNYLGEAFVRIIEFPHKQWMAKVTLNKEEYLTLIEDGWKSVREYDYQRDHTEIHIAPDGLSGLSYSTVIENVVQPDGTELTSKFREYATYELENGRPVITLVNGHTLVGDTTPYH